MKSPNPSFDFLMRYIYLISHHFTNLQQRGMNQFFFFFYTSHIMRLEPMLYQLDVQRNNNLLFYETNKYKGNINFIFLKSHQRTFWKIAIFMSLYSFRNQRPRDGYMDTSLKIRCERRGIKQGSSTTYKIMKIIIKIKYLRT